MHIFLCTTLHLSSQKSAFSSKKDECESAAKDPGYASLNRRKC